jgi:hypothetical protein
MNKPIEVRLTKLVQDIIVQELIQTKTLSNIIDLLGKHRDRLNEQEADIKLIYSKLKKKGII